MVVETRYDIARAAADLQDAGLLAGILRPDPATGRMAPAGRAGAGSFHGADLDSRKLLPGRLFVALAGERVDGRDYVAQALRAGGWSLTRTWDGRGDDPLQSLVAADGGVLLSHDPEAALTRLARCWRGRRRVTVIGVTGSNGKTTTKDLLAALLRGAGPTLATRGNFNNRLGVPLTLLEIEAAHRFAVIEMGASAVGDIARLATLARPEVGLITNAGPAHLAEFGSLDGVVEGKGELLDGLPSDGTAVLNAESPGFRRWCARANARVVSHGRHAGDHRWSWRRGDGGGAVLMLDGQAWGVPLPGEHNGANLASAILAARAVGLDDTQIGRGLAGFVGSPHRGVELAVAGRRVLDESYNANPASVEAACEALVRLSDSGRSFAVLGAMAELGPDSDELHRETGRRAAAAGVDVLLAVGDAARPLGEGFDAAGGEAHYCATCAAAADLLAGRSVAGDRILIKGSRSAAMERLLPLLNSALAD